MTTAAQRDRQITAAKRKLETATTKRDKAKADLAEQEATVETQTKRIAWLEQMPVDDAPNGEGSGEMTRALDSVEGGGSAAPDEDADQPL